MSEPLRFQHFQVLAKPDGSPQILGQGAMGTTFKAFDTNLHSIVVIKVINPQYVTNPIARQRFLQEAQAMAKIQHPNVATAFHLSENSQGLFFAMEFCDGPNLQEYVEANGPMQCGDALMVVQHVSSALQAAQKVHLVHRDLKPSNLILVKDEQNHTITKVIDFGLARTFGEKADASTDLTAGGFVGTANYASPEQLLEQCDLDTRSDIYSLGITLWYMLCAAPTFRGSHFETMAGHVNEEPPWENLPSIPDSALAIIKRMLQKSPEQRYQTPSELWDDVQNCLVSEGLTYAGAGLSIRIRKEKSTEGSILGTNNFEIGSEIGSGQTGKVFLGKDTISGERVAIKFLHKDLINVPGIVRDIRHQLRFLDSVEPHPNILRTLAFDYSEKDSEARIIMEWVEGTTLLSLLRTWRKMNFQDALPLIVQLAQGVDFALRHDLGHLELALHQILIHTPTVSRDRAQESEFLQQSLQQWPEFEVKLDPLRISWTPEQHASTIPGSDSDPGQTLVGERGLLPEESGSLLYRFSYIVYRLLGGVVTDIGKLHRYTQLAALSEEGNEILESFLLTDDPERSGISCTQLVTDLCKTEQLELPPSLATPIVAAPDAREEELDSTDHGNFLDQSPTLVDLPSEDPGATVVVPRERSSSSRSSVSGLGLRTSGFRSASTAGLGSSAFRSTRAGGSSFSSEAPTSSSGLGDAAFDQQRREVELKLRRLELERIAAEEEAERLSREEALEMQRRIVEEQRHLLEQQKADLERQLVAEKKAVEEERKILTSERNRLDQESGALREQISKQEASLESEKLKQQYEFQKFLEERKHWEEEKNVRHQKHLLELQEAQERLYLEENKISKQVEADRLALEAGAAELAEKQARLQLEAQDKESASTAEIEAERHQIEEERRNLEARLQRQTLDLDEAQRQVEAAKQELQQRSEAMQREAAAKDRERESTLQRQREELETARAEIKQQEQLLREAREQQEYELHQRFAAEQLRLDEAAAGLAAQEERANLSQEAVRKEEDLQRLRQERQALEEERIKLQTAHDQEEEQRKARELADTEALRARESEIEELKARLGAEEQERREVVSRQEAELEEILTKERASLAEERQRIVSARESGGVLAANNEQDRTELEALRAQLELRSQELEQRDAQQQEQHEAELRRQQEQLKAQQNELNQRRNAFDQEQEYLLSRVDAERRRLTEIEQARQAEEQKLQKEEAEYDDQVRRRAAEFSALEAAEEKKLTELRERVSAEEGRLATEREKIAAIERENDFNLKITQQTRDDFNEDAGAATKRHEELNGLLEQIKREQRKRVATIVVGFLLLSTVGTFAAVKGKVIFDNWRVQGTKEWIAHSTKATEYAASQDWAQLLTQVVMTDKTLAGDPVYADKHGEVRPVLMGSADQAVKGLLADAKAGKLVPLDEIASRLSSLTYASEWEPVADKKLLAAKLQLARAVGDNGNTAAEAVLQYIAACIADPSFVTDLAPDLARLSAILDTATADGKSITRRDELVNALTAVPETAYSSNPRLVLVIGKLVADSERDKKQYDRALRACIDTFRHGVAEDDWLEALRPDVNKILDDLEQIAHQIELDPLVASLTQSARIWSLPRPFMILARSAPQGSQDQSDYYRDADKLGDLEAKTHVGMFDLLHQPNLGGKLSGVKMVEESAAANNPFGLYALATIHLELHGEVGWQPDYETALAAAKKAKEGGHPDAAAYEGKILLTMALESKSMPQLESARELLHAAAGPEQAEAYFDLFTSYLRQDFSEGDAVQAHSALVDGAAHSNPNCMFNLALWCENGIAPQELNLTKARDLHLRLVINIQLQKSIDWLQRYARFAQGQDDWIDSNRHIWE